MEHTQYNNEMVEYWRKVDGVGKVKCKILRTVATSKLQIAISGSRIIDAKELLIALKRRLSSRTTDNQYKVQQKYDNLHKSPKQNLEKWLDDWTLIEQEIQQSEIDGSFDI
ncbi:hypothetical protein I7I53_08972 [Histoplasma capsulatum var. duboisii H88]|uniref:Uncharacterized protein n=1 Tax=Ajellomyces capsulatus (strain H88) TaxID=544711 RepID=A0A8A1LAP6_AJEC8|nr:hypothetical protein I7I53_08972 [Histoplasma capsulatum var. duboisii H88]